MNTKEPLGNGRFESDIVASDHETNFQLPNDVMHSRNQNYASPNRTQTTLRDYRFLLRVKYLFGDSHYLDLHEKLQTEEIPIGSSNDYICYFLNEELPLKIVGFLVVGVQIAIYTFAICTLRDEEISNSYIDYDFVTIVVSFYVAISVISNSSDTLNKILFSNLTWPFVSDYIPDEINVSNFGWVMVFAIFKPMINVLHFLYDVGRSILHLHTTATPSLTFHKIAVCIIMIAEVFIQFLLINTTSLVVKFTDEIYILLVEIFGLYFVIQLDEIVAQFFRVKVDCLVLSVDRNMQMKWRRFRILSRVFYMLLYTCLILFLSSVKVKYATFCEYVIV
jgi:hypothetical protein